MGRKESNQTNKQILYSRIRQNIMQQKEMGISTLQKNIKQDNG